MQRFVQNGHCTAPGESQLSDHQARCLDALFTVFVELLGMIFTAGAKVHEDKQVDVQERSQAKQANQMDEEEEDDTDSASECSMVDTRRVSSSVWGGSQDWREIYSEWLATEIMMRKKGMCDVNEETKDEFRSLIYYIYRSKDRGLVIEAIKGVMGKVWKWVKEHLDDWGLPGAATVEELLQAVREDINDLEGREELSRFLRVMLRDETVVGFLRRVRDVSGVSKEGQLCGKMARFDVHFGVVCVSCDVKPIVGSRFVNVSRQNFNLCADCYYKSDIAQNDMQFRECRYVWESILPGFCAPPAKLAVGDRGPRVKFLHKVLMDMDIMTKEIYPGKMGCFGENTKAAVRRFQKVQGLEGRCEDGVYDTVTAERLESVVEGREVQTSGKARSHQSLADECTAMSD